MKIIGITGKTGSGKSTAASYLNSRLQDSMILDADRIAKDVYRENKNVVGKLRFCFGEDIADCDDKVDYKKLGSIVFADCSKMEKLDEIMLPLIEEKVKEYILKNNSKSGYMIIDAAILFKSKIYKYCNKIILVKSDLKNRRKRLKNKNNSLSESDLEDRLKNQKIIIIGKKIDFIIENNSKKEDLYEKLEKVIKSLAV